MVLWASAALLAGIVLAVHGSGRLPPHLDLRVFGPPALSVARDGSLANPVWGESALLNPDGAQVFTSHGPLFPWAVGTIVRPRSYDALLWTLAAARAATVLLAAAVLDAGVRRHPGAATGWLAVVALPAAMTWVVLLPPGRPEDVVAPLLLLAVAGLAQVRGWPRVALGTLAVAVVGSLSPLAGVVAGLGVLALLAAEHDDRGGLVRGVGVAAAAGLGSAAMFLVYPLSVERWWYGFSRAADVAVRVPMAGGGGAGSIRLSGWLLLALLTAFVVAAARDRRPAVTGAAVVGLAVCVAVALVAWFGYVKPRPYNAWPWAVVLVAAATWVAGPRPSRVLTGVLAAAALVGVLNVGVLVATAAGNPVAREEVRSAVASLDPSGVGVTDRTFALGPAGARPVDLSETSDPATMGDVEALVVGEGELSDDDPRTAWRVSTTVEVRTTPPLLQALSGRGNEPQAFLVLVPPPGRG